MGAVPDFGLALLKPLGAQSGKVETFTEVPFKRDAGSTVRADGVIVVTRGTKTWRAIVEAKVAGNQLQAAQMNAYLDLARDLDFQAVLSISNQYVTSSTEYPIEIDRRKLRHTTLHHWSWIDLLTEAIVQKEYRGISDPDQAYILGELIRYLSDPRSGAVAFEGMGSGWTATRDGARTQTLRKTDGPVIATAARWDDLIRYLALGLTTELGREVKQSLPPKERTPVARRQALVDSLVSTGRLYADLQIPNVAGSLSLCADLRSRQVVASTGIDAPREGTSKGRVSWLLRQLQSAPETLTVESRISWRSTSLAAPLSAVRDNPAVIYPEKGREIKSFVLSSTSNMGVKRDAGRGSFVESLSQSSESFYRDVLQRLRPWKAAPPQLKRAGQAEEPKRQEVAEMVGVEPDQIADPEGIEPAVSRPAATWDEATRGQDLRDRPVPT